jgi:hypothetical protein
MMQVRLTNRSCSLQMAWTAGPLRRTKPLAALLLHRRAGSLLEILIVDSLDDLTRIVVAQEKQDTTRL